MVNDAEPCGHGKARYLAKGKIEGLLHIAGVIECWREACDFVTAVKVVDTLLTLIAEEVRDTLAALARDEEPGPACDNKPPWLRLPPSLCSDQAPAQKERAPKMTTEHQLLADRLADLVRGARAFTDVINGLAIKNTVVRVEAQSLVRQATNQLAVSIIEEGLTP
jgi:hypothetical protein